MVVLLIAACNKPSTNSSINPNNPVTSPDSSKTELSFNYNGKTWDCKGHKNIGPNLAYKDADSGNFCFFVQQFIYNNPPFYQYRLSGVNNPSSNFVQILFNSSSRINPPVTLNSTNNANVLFVINNTSYGNGGIRGNLFNMNIQSIDSSYVLWNWGGLAINGTFDGKLFATNGDSIVITEGKFIEIPMQ